MKKSRKLTGILLSCCALLMVAIAGLGVTLAKYTKSAPEKGGSANVAKFGVAMAWSSGADLFSDTYELKETVTGVDYAVKSSSDVIAPGTSGSVTLSFAGSVASEVAFNLKINISETYSNNWKTSAEGAVYHPISYLVTSTAKANNVEITGISEAAATVDLNFAPGTTLSGDITITWSWAFEKTDGTAEEKAAVDLADTYMSTVSGATYSITANAIVTQID